MKCNYQFPTVPDSGIIAYPEGSILRVFYDITPAPLAPRESEEEENNLYLLNIEELLTVFCRNTTGYSYICKAHVVIR